MPQPQPQPKTTRPPQQPYRTLVTAFAAWKLFLFLVALGSSLAGEAYDTSAGLVVQGSGSGSKDGRAGGLVARLSSWDAIYFITAARRGYRFEQEWAFGAGLPFVVRGVLGGEFLFIGLDRRGFVDHVVFPGVLLFVCRVMLAGFPGASLNSTI